MWIRPRVTAEDKKEINSIVFSSFAAFIWTLLAFWWSMVIWQILDLVSVKLESPWFSIVIALIYAIAITIFSVIFLVSIKWIITRFISLLLVVEDENPKKAKKDEFEL